MSLYCTSLCFFFLTHLSNLSHTVQRSAVVTTAEAFYINVQRKFCWSFFRCDVFLVLCLVALAAICE